MKTFYQVCSNYSFQKGKAQLVSLSLHSTPIYYPYFVKINKSPLVSSRFFYSVSDAENYINYLFTIYPHSTAPRPVLDANQLTFF
jgi:hypothetical protein